MEVNGRCFLFYVKIKNGCFCITQIGVIVNSKLLSLLCVFTGVLPMYGVHVAVVPKKVKSIGRSNIVKRQKVFVARAQEAQRVRIKALSQKLLQEVSGHSHSLKKIKKFIAAGADVNAKDEFGRSVLRLASRLDGNIEIVRELIKAGADVNAHKDDVYVFEYAANGEIAKELIKAGADVNARDKDGRTPLMFGNDVGVVKELIKAGADVNARDNHGFTPLMREQSVGGIKELLKAGADVNAVNESGGTALMYQRDVNVVKELIKAGADVNIQNKSGGTALMYACTICYSPTYIRKGVTSYYNTTGELVKVFVRSGGTS